MTSPRFARIGVELRVIGALGLRAIRQTLRRPQLAAPVIVFPSLFLAVTVGGAGRAIDLQAFPEVAGFLDFELPGALLQATMMAGLAGGIAMALDIEMGFTDRLFAAPISRFSLVLGRLAGTALAGGIAAVWFIAVGLIFGVSIEGGVLGGLLMFVLAIMAAVAFGAVGAALALRTGKASSTQGVFPLVFVVLFLSSAFFPRHLMLEPAATIARWNPFSFIAEGMRDPVISTISTQPLLEGLAGVALIGAIGIAASGVALRRRLRLGG